MAKYRLSKAAKEDLIRIHHLGVDHLGLDKFGVDKFGVRQADKYFNSFFEYFDTISYNPFAFEAIDYIRKGYRRCPCGSDTIYFRLNDGVVEIMAIVGRQDLNNKL